MSILCVGYTLITWPLSLYICFVCTHMLNTLFGTQIKNSINQNFR